MGKEMTKMPDGSFAVDEEELVIERSNKAPYIPTIKLKGGSSELPPEVTNAVETHGMGWTDEDETVHKIDEKYIPSSGSLVVNASMDTDESGFFSNIEVDNTIDNIVNALKTSNVFVNIMINYSGDEQEISGYFKLVFTDGMCVPVAGYDVLRGDYQIGFAPLFVGSKESGIDEWGEWRFN